MVATIEAAIASLADSLPDATLPLRHGEASGNVLSASSRELSGDTVFSDAPQEMRRVVGKRSDFPDLAKGCTVELGESYHIVTSARTDPVGASLTIGLSAALGAVVATYRRPGTSIRQPLNVLAVESETLDAWSDDLAPTASRAWFVACSSADWLETSDPQTGDEITIDERVLRVAAVAKHDGYWLLTCRGRR
jgi:hypothetical protein